MVLALVYGPSFVLLSGSLITMSPSNAFVGSTYTATVTLSDGVNTASFSYNIAVGNQPPLFSPALVTQTIHSHLTTLFTPGAVDPEGSAVIMTLAGLQTWMAFDGVSLTMVPPLTSLGTFIITATIADSVSNIVTQTFSVIVINNPPAFLTPLTTQSLAAGVTVSYTLLISDFENDSITISLVAPLIYFASISGSVITLSPSISDTGTFLISG